MYEIYINRLQVNVKCYIYVADRLNGKGDNSY